MLQGGPFNSLPNTFFNTVINALAIPFFALLGMLFYVCASAATPLVAVLLFNGISPGTALAFLITGPTTNLALIGMLSHLHGRKTAIFFAAGTFAAAVFAGYASDMLIGNFHPIALGEEDAPTSRLQILALACLLTLYLYAILRRGARAFIMELLPRQTPGQHNH